MKDLETRLREAVEVRKALRDAGLLVDPEVDRGLREATDAFVRHAEQRVVVLEGPTGVRVRLELVVERGRQSGAAVVV